MSRIKQEFYCGECQGYFLVNLNMSLNIQVDVVCPSCGHKHRRYIKDGLLKEDGRDCAANAAKEELLGLKATYSKTAVTQKMRDTLQKSGAYHEQRRDGVPLSDHDREYAEAVRTDMMAERWIEKASDERGET